MYSSVFSGVSVTTAINISSSIYIQGVPQSVILKPLEPYLWSSIHACNVCKPGTSEQLQAWMLDHEQGSSSFRKLLFLRHPVV